MKIIVLTQPDKVTNEAEILVEILKSGVDKIHIRKQNCTEKYVEYLIDNIPTIYHHMLSIHYYFNLLEKFPLINYHHSGDSVYNKKIHVNQTKSCHSLIELKNNLPYEYLFISPVFDSISKAGYLAKIDLSELKNYLYNHDLKNIVAMGGINNQNITSLKDLPLYGIALLGSVWSSSDPLAFLDSLKLKLK